MEFWIDVENAAGTVQGSGPIRSATGWRQTRRLNGAGTFAFSFPASDTAALGLLTAKRIVRCWAVLGGVVTEVGAGIVDEVATEWDATGALMATVRGPDLLAELKRSLIRTQLASVDFDNVKYIPRTLITTFAGGLSWSIEDEDGNTLDGDVTAENVYARFRAEPVLAGLVRVAETVGEFFRQGTDRTLVWIGPVDDFPASGVRAVAGAEPVALGAASGLCAITHFEKLSDSADWANYAIVTGSGTGDIRVGLRAATTWPDGFTDATSGTTTMTWSGDIATGDDADGTWKVDRAYGYVENYDHRLANGYYEIRLDYSDQGPQANTDADAVSTANGLVQASYHYLKARSVTPVFYRLGVAGLDRIVYPGTTIRTVARRFVDGAAVLDVDEDLRILETSWEVTDRGLHTVDLTVTDGQRFPVSGDGRVVEEVKKNMVFRGHPQANLVYYEMPFVENFDDVWSAYCDFALGSAVVSVQSVILEFMIDSFRGTIDGVAVGGTSGSATGNTGSGGNHFHLVNTTATPTNPTGAVMFFVDGSPGSITAGTASGTFSTQGESAHVHDLGSHTHAAGSLTATPNQGIYSNLTKATTGEITIEINSGTPSNSVTGPTGSWYTLDLTADVRDGTTYRPTQANHRVSVIADANYAGLLRARVQVQVVVQGLA